MVVLGHHQRLAHRDLTVQMKDKRLLDGGHIVRVLVERGRQRGGPQGLLPAAEVGARAPGHLLAAALAGAAAQRAGQAVVGRRGDVCPKGQVGEPDQRVERVGRFTFGRRSGLDQRRSELVLRPARALLGGHELGDAGEVPAVLQRIVVGLGPLQRDVSRQRRTSVVHTGPEERRTRAALQPRQQQVPIRP